MALFGKKSDASTGSGSSSSSSAPGTTTAPAKGGKGGLFGKGKKGADAAPAAAPVAPAGDAAGTDAGAGFEDFSDFGATFGGPSPEVPRAPVNTTRARPKVLGGTAIGLNIGNAAIKVVELRASGGSIKVTGAGMVHTPLESLSNGVIISQASLSNAIRSAMQAAGIKSKAVTTAVSGTGSIVVRVVELPRMSDKELEETMKTDAEKFIPFAPEEVRLDFRALRELPTPPDSPNMDVLIAAAQREVLYQYGDAIKAARLTPRAIEVEPLAATRALSHSVEGSEVNYARVTAAINIGATATEISVMRGDILVFTRTLPSGGNSLTQALVDYLGLSETEAERVKVEFGDALPSFSEGGGMAPAASGSGFDSAFGGDGGDDWANLDFDAPDLDDASTSAVSLQKDAPEQHGQKEDDDPNAPAKPAFDFSAFDMGDAPAEGPATAAPISPAAPAVPDATSAPGGFSFDFGMPDEPAATAPLTSPSVVTPDDPHAAPGGVSSTVISFAKPDVPAIEFADFAPEAAPEAALPVAPVAAAGASTSEPPAASSLAPDAFNFSFDSEPEPAASTAPTAPLTPTMPVRPSIPAPPSDTEPGADAPASAFDFDFSGEGAAGTSAQAAAPAASEPSSEPSVDITKSPAISDPSMMLVEAGDTSAWGLDDLSATPSASAPAASLGAALSPAAGAEADPFDLDTIFSTPGDASGVALGDADPFATSTAGAAGMAGGFASPAAGAVDDPFGSAPDLGDFGAGLTNDIAPGVDAPTVYSILHPLLDELAGEIRRSLEYHASRYPEAVVQNIELIGGGAKLRNLDAFLTQSLGIPASVADPLRNMGDVPANVRADSPAYAIAVGLALRELLA